MTDTISEYLAQLKSALAQRGCDAATVQDALADAEDHLHTALENARQQNAAAAENELLPAIIEGYGSPEEIAAAYREVERRQPPGLAPAAPRPSQNPSVFASFFGVFGDPRAWGALIYMLISLLTGILYFTWAVAGLSLSAGLIVLIIGLPFMAFFMLSVRGLAVLEGRIVEALLGVRMPRRPIFIDQSQGWWNRLKELFLSWQTWKAILYMLLMLPIGVVYFSVMVTLIALGLGLTAAPLAQLVFHLPLVTFNSSRYFLPDWGLPLISALGVLVLVGSLHLARLTGRLQGTFARWMLVSE